MAANEWPTYVCQPNANDIFESRTRCVVVVAGIIVVAGNESIHLCSFRFTISFSGDTSLHYL